MSEIKKFQVFKSVGEVFSGVTRHYFELLWVARFAAAVYAAMWALLIIMFSSVMGYGTAVGSEAETLKTMAPVSTLILFVLVILLIVSALAAAVQWHRFVLLGERDGPLLGQFKFGYFWTSLKMSFMAIPIMLAAIFVFGIPAYLVSMSGALGSSATYAIFGAVTLAYIPVLIWIVRASLALPDVALGGLGSVFTAWEKTKGNSLRLLGYTLIIQVIVSAASNLAQMLIAAILKPVFASVITPLAGQEQLAAGLICLPLALYTVMVGVTMLSVAYREIIGLPQVPEGQL